MLQMFDEIHKFEKRAHGLQCVYCKRFLSQIIAMSEDRREAAERKCEELQKQIGSIEHVSEIKSRVKNIAESRQLNLFNYSVKKGD